MTMKCDYLGQYCTCRQAGCSRFVRSPSILDHEIMVAEQGSGVCIRSGPPKALSLPLCRTSGRCQVQWGKAHIKNHFYDALRLPQTFFPLFLSFLLYNFIDHLPMYSLKKNKYKNLFWTQKPKWPKAGKFARKSLIIQGPALCRTSDTVAFLQTPLSFRQNCCVNQVYSLCSPFPHPEID